MNLIDLALTKVSKFKIPESITTDKDFKHASDGLAGLKMTENGLETQRKSITKPLLIKKRQIDAEYKVPLDAIRKVTKEIKVKIAKYYRLKEKQQKQLEQNAIAAHPEASEILVEDTVHELRHNEYSTTSVKALKRYRTKDPALHGIVEIKLTKMQEYLKSHKLPDFIEEYEVDSVTVRGK